MTKIAVGDEIGGKNNEDVVELMIDLKRGKFRCDMGGMDRSLAYA